MLLKNHIKRDLQRGEGGHTSPEAEAATAELLKGVEANRKKIVNLGPKERDVELVLDTVERQKDYTHAETISHFEKLGKTEAELEAEKREIGHTERENRFQKRDAEEQQKLQAKIAAFKANPSAVVAPGDRINTEENYGAVLKGNITEIQSLLEFRYGIKVEADGSIKNSLKDKFLNAWRGTKPSETDHFFDLAVAELKRRHENIKKTTAEPPKKGLLAKLFRR